MKDILIKKGILSPSGKIQKDKINLVSGAIVKPFAEMIWVTTDGDIDAINRLTNIMNTNKTKYTAIALALAVALLAGSAIMAVGLVENTKKPADVIDDVSAGLVFDESAVEGGWEQLSQEEIEDRLNNQLEEGMINISMNTSPYFEDGTSKGNLMIVNETINRYPQKVQIIRNDTDEIIYTSGAIAVGSKIETAALDVDLDAGEYECTALFHNLDNSGNIIGSAGAIITITIKN